MRDHRQTGHPLRAVPNPPTHTECVRCDLWYVRVDGEGCPCCKLAVEARRLRAGLKAIADWQFETGEGRAAQKTARNALKEG